MAVRAEDTFTATAGTMLENHTPSPTGTAWQVDTVKVWLIGDLVANKVANAEGANAFAKETTDITKANMKVEAAVQIQDNAIVEGTGVVTRYPSATVATTANQDGFAAILEGNADKTGADVVLYRLDNGSETELGRYNANVANNTEVTIRLESNGDNHEVFVDGTSRIGPVTDSAHNTNQFAGIFGKVPEGSILDNFKSEDVGATTTNQTATPTVTVTVVFSRVFDAFRTFTPSATGSACITGVAGFGTRGDGAAFGAGRGAGAAGAASTGAVARPTGARRNSAAWTSATSAV